MCVCPGDDLAISQILSSACERSTVGPVPLSAAVSGSVSDQVAHEAGRKERKKEQAKAEECGSVFQQSVVT